MRPTLSRTRIFSCTFGLLAVLAGTAFAQDFRGAVAGRVTDSSGAVLPGVTVTVTNNPNLDPTSATFGLVSSQNNLPRNIQLGMKVVF